MATNGNKGKFSERLKKIIFFRKRKKVDHEEEIQLEDSNRIYTNFLKVVAAIPGFVYDNVKIEDKANYVEKNYTNVHNNDVKKQKGHKISKINTMDSIVRNGKYSQQSVKNNMSKAAKRKIINDISLDDIKNKQYSYTGSSIHNDTNSVDRAKELEKSIINLIKKNLIKVVNEMEILQSELYILSEVNGESKVLKDCQRELDQVKSMLCKIDKLKEQYDFLKDNYDFEYLLEIDNNDIVDKIIELKNTFGNNELKAVAEDYKLLEVYKYLYLKIDDLQEKTALFEEEKAKEIEKLKQRDIDFEQLKQDVYNVEYNNKNYENFVNNQNELLKEIDENVNKINSYEQVNYHLKGFGKLFSNTVKYFGLLMISPLKGIIPSIATETLITRNLIKNLYNNLEWEEERRTVYEAVNYAGLINNAIIDLESTSNIVDATLEDIVRLKMKYNDQFKKYQGDFLQYQEIMHKINDMENKILGNKIKIEMMKKRALDQQRANNKKLALVKELNEKK